MLSSQFPTAFDDVPYLGSAGASDATSAEAPAANGAALAADGKAAVAGEGEAAAKKKKGKKKLKQTEPPSIHVSRFFPDGVYPEGEWQPYKQE